MPNLIPGHDQWLEDQLYHHQEEGQEEESDE